MTNDSSNPHEGPKREADRAHTAWCWAMLACGLTGSEVLTLGAFAVLTANSIRSLMCIDRYYGYERCSLRARIWAITRGL